MVELLAAAAPITLRRVLRSEPKRGARLINGRAESAFMCKLADHTSIYRVYEDWTLVEPNRWRIKAKDRLPIPLVVIVKGVKHILTPAQHAQLEQAPKWGWADV